MQSPNAVDGLILVDLLRADRRLLARYIGKEVWLRSAPTMLSETGGSL